MDNRVTQAKLRNTVLFLELSVAQLQQECTRGETAIVVIRKTTDGTNRAPNRSRWTAQSGVRL